MEDNEKRELAEEVKSKVPGAKQVNVNVIDKKGVPMPPNIMVFQTFAYLAATKLKPSTNKVLMLFFANSGYENYVGMDVVTIAEKLDITERTTIRALNELEKNNIIIKTHHPADRRRNDYFLNPYSAWKGHSVSRKKMLEIMPDNQLTLFGIPSRTNADREKAEIRTGTQYLGE